MCDDASRCTWIAVESRGRIRQGVRGTHSDGRVIRDGSIPPSTLECISVPFFLFFFFPSFLSLFLSLFISFFLSPASRGLKARSYCAPLSKNTWAWTGERVSVSDTGFNRTKWKGTRSMEISHRYFLLRSHFERIINTACYWILLYDRITLDGPAAAVKKEKKK